MLKKTVSIFLVLGMILCLSSCGKPKVSNEPLESQVITTQSSAEIQEQSHIEETPENTENSAATTTIQSTNKPATNTQANPTHTHSYENATCTSPKVCSCGATAGTALGHSFGNATCTSPKICSRCGATSGSALGHSYSNATCTSPKTCSRCGNTEGGALGHNYVNNKCSRCGIVDPDSLPVGLDKLHVIDSSNYQYETISFTDSYGNIYNGIHNFCGRYSGDAYVIYNLNGKYKTFSGTIAPSPGLQSYSFADFNIYLDDILVYSKTQLEKTSNKINFNIDVKNSMKLTIKVKTYYKPNVIAVGYAGNGVIANAQLSK